MVSHLKEYLNYYAELENPGYAVLVKGEWGIGKTFQVNQALEGKSYCYVSLFGLKNENDIHNEILAKIIEIKALEQTEKIELSILDKIKSYFTEIPTYQLAVDMFGSFLPENLKSSLVKTMIKKLIPQKCVLILDDLERCELDTQTKLGVINQYVEHNKLNVVVIAHDKKLVDNFSEMKEKLFGHIIQVEPQITKAFDTFCDEVNQEQNTIKLYKDYIVGVFKSSEYNSLRVLRYIILDLARLFRALEQKHLNHQQAMKELVCLFCALSIEVRMGRLDENDLLKRQDQFFSFHIRERGNNLEEQNALPALIDANKKYANIDLTNTILNDETITQTLINGYYSKETIRNSLNNSSYFLEQQDEPNWKMVSHFDVLDDELVDQAISGMNEQFISRSITSSGEMLHVFSLRLLMALHDQIERTVQDEAEECIRYIDDLKNQNRLPASELSPQWTEKFRTGHAGFSFWVTNETREHFQRIWAYLISSRKEIFDNELPAIGQSLLDMMQDDTDSFLEAVSQTNNGDNLYALIPALRTIPPSNFVEAWLNIENKNMRKVAYALESRYQHARLQHELSSERDWIQQVITEISDKANDEIGLKALRIKRLITNQLHNYVQASETD